MDKKHDLISLETGASPDQDEIRTVTHLVSLFGEPIRFLKESDIDGVRTPDILWNKRKWEIKNPRADGKYTIERCLQTASGQSENIIVDIRGSKMHESKALS